MIEVNRALGRNAQARGRRKTPSCPSMPGLVARVAHFSQGSCVPPAWSPVPSQGALATREVCLSAETGICSGHPSQSEDEDSPAPAAPTAKNLGSLWNLSGFWDKTIPIWPEEAKSVAWAVLALRCGHGGSYLPTACEVPKDCSHPSPAATSWGVTWGGPWARPGPRSQNCFHSAQQGWWCFSFWHLCLPMLPSSLYLLFIYPLFSFIASRLPYCLLQSGCAKEGQVGGPVRVLASLWTPSGSPFSTLA